MNRIRKISSPSSQLALFLILLGAAWVAGNLAGGIVLLFKGGIKGHPSVPDMFSDPRMVNAMKLTQAIATIVIFGIPAWFYARLTYRERPLYYLGFRPVRLPLFYVLAIAVILFSFPLDGWLGQVNKGIPLPPWAIGLERAAEKQITLFLKADSSFEIVINVILIAVLPAIFEEACFRGALQRILIQLFNRPWIGILVTAFFFSAFHMQFQGFLPRMFLGILLGALYWYSGSLWVSILAHFVTNGVQVVAVSLYPRLIDENPQVPAYAALLSLLIVVGLLFIMRKRSDTNFALEYGLEN